MKPGDLIWLPTSNYAGDYLNIFKMPQSDELRRSGKFYFGETGIFLESDNISLWHKVMTSSGSIGWVYTGDLEVLSEAR